MAQVIFGRLLSCMGYIADPLWADFHSKATAFSFKIIQYRSSHPKNKNKNRSKTAIYNCGLPEKKGGSNPFIFRRLECKILF